MSKFYQKNTHICKIISGGTVLTKLQMTVFQNGGQSNKLILPESVFRLSTEKLVLRTISKSSKSCEIYTAALVFLLSDFVQQKASNNNNRSLSSLLCFARYCFARFHFVINLKMCSPQLFWERWWLQLGVELWRIFLICLQGRFFRDNLWKYLLFLLLCFMNNWC